MGTDYSSICNNLVIKNDNLSFLHRTVLGDENGRGKKTENKDTVIITK